MKKITACAAMAALTLPGSSSVLTWNSPAAGGTWDTTTLSWTNGASAAAWNNATPDSAIFGTTGAGTVALGTAINAAGLTFNAAGYTVSGNTLTLAGTTPTITAASDAAISSIISGTAGLTKAGAGTLDLGGTNSYTGSTVVSAGTLKLSTPQATTGPILVNAGTLALNAGSNASGYRLTQTSQIDVASGANVSMLVAFPWGWYTNNNATGLTVNLNGGTFKLNNLIQGSWGIKLGLTGGTLDGGGATSRWELGRSGGFDGKITSLASPTTSSITAGIIMMRGDSGQTSYPFEVAQGTTASGVDLDISSSIRSTGTGVLTKTGAGNLHLTGVSTAVSATLVSAGKLSLGSAAAYPSTPITISPGALFDVSERTDFTVASGKTLVAGRTGTPATDITGNITLAAGGFLSPGGVGTVGTLSVAGNLALSGGTVNLEQSAGSSDKIAATGALALTGTNTFSASAGYFPAGTYTLLSGYSSVTGSAANLAWGSAARGQTASFAVTSTDVKMTLSGGTPSSLTWSGTSSGVWDVNTTANWNAGVDKFFQLDNVTFPDSPTTATVTVTGAVAPTAMSFTNATTAYVVRGGTGSIAGPGSLTKSAAGALTLWNNANTYSGGTTISAGTLTLNNGATLAAGTYTPLGTGAISLPTGGTLQLNPGNGTGGVYSFPNAINLSGGVLYEDDGINHFTGLVTVTSPSIIKGHYGGKDIYLDGGLAGSGDLIISDEQGYALYGAGAVYVTADGSYSGNVTVDLGHLVIGSNNALQNAKVAVQTTQQNDGWARNVGMTLAGATTNATLAGLSGSSATAYVQNADATARTLTVNNSTDQLFAGVIGSGTLGDTDANRISIVKSGTGSLNLSGTNTYTGSTTVNGGALTVASSNSSLVYSVGNGAALGVNIQPASPTLIVNSLTLGATTGASLNLLNFSGGTQPAIDTLDLTTHGTVTINVAGSFSNGTFPLITSANAIGGSGSAAFVLGTLPRGIAATIVKTSTTVNLVVTGTNSLVWKGNVSTAWDLNTTSNWTLGGVANKFLDGDTVLFDNTAGANTNVVLGTAVAPSGVTVNSSANYVISGAGAIGGTGGITKSGTGTLDVGTANTFGGDVQVLAGKLKVSNNAALGSTAGATSVASGGALDLNGAVIGAESLSLAGSGAAGAGALVNDSATASSLAGVISIAGPTTIGGSGALTLSSNISGVEELVKTGSGTLNLGARSTGFTGGFTVASGTVNLLAANMLPNSIKTVQGTLSVGLNNAMRNPNENVTVKTGGLLTIANTFTTNFGTNTSGSSFLTLEGGSELGAGTPDPLYGSWTINTVNRTITVAGGSAQPAKISAPMVTPDGANPLRLAVSDLTGDAATDLIVTGYFGAPYYTTPFDVEIDGGGAVEFSGVNTYTGSTKVLSGKLVTTIPDALAAASTVNLSASASLVLDFEGTQTVAALIIDGTTMPNGTYGTGATVNSHISGTGKLEVGVTTGSPYATWATLHGIDGATADQDSDGDGIANGIEFILGADPSGPGSDSHALLPTLTTGTTTMTFVFRAREDALSLAHVEYDADLAGTWSTAADGTDGVTIATESGIYPNDAIDNQPVSRVTVTIPRSGVRLFARLVGTFE